MNNSEHTKFTCTNKRSMMLNIKFLAKFGANTVNSNCFCSNLEFGETYL